MYKTAVCLLILVAVAACDGSPRSAKGFRLPDGDAERGLKTFMALECHGCHRIDGLVLPEPAQPGPLTFTLGGPVTRVKTYGELVTAIINPSHRLAPGAPTDRITPALSSPMPVYNDILTVTELVDLVAFLQPRYRVTMPELDYPPFAY